MAYPTDDKENRIRSVMNNVVGTEDPDDVMLELLSVLEEGGKVPSLVDTMSSYIIPKHLISNMTKTLSWQ